MKDVNQVVIIGRLTRDIEVKHISDKTLALFAIATNGYKEDVSFIDVQVWGSQAENCAKYLKKGSQVCVCGSIKQDRWKDKEGNSRSKITINANVVQFLSTRNSDPDQVKDIWEGTVNPEFDKDLGSDIPF